MENHNPVDFKPSNSYAAIWSMMLPGLGQMMKGRIMPGLIWAALVASGYYAFFWPGLVIHGLCILDAGFYKGEGSFMDLNTWSKKLSFLILIGFLIGYIYYRNI